MKRWLQFEGRTRRIEVPDDFAKPGRHTCMVDDHTIDADVSVVEMVFSLLSWTVVSTAVSSMAMRSSLLGTAMNLPWMTRALYVGAAAVAMEVQALVPSRLQCRAGSCVF